MTQPTTIVPVRTVGIDLGDQRSSYCVLNAAGETVEEGSVRNDQEVLKRVLGSTAGTRSILESSCQSGWFSRLLTELGHEVIVANPRQVHLISKSERKSDRNDARLLARIGRFDPGLLHPVTQRSERNAVARGLLRARAGLIQVRTKLVNMVRSETKVLGSRLPTCGTKVFHQKARGCLPEQLRDALTPVLDALAQVQEHIEHYGRSNTPTSAGVIRNLHPPA